MQRQNIAIIIGIVALLILVLGLLTGPMLVMGGPGMIGAMRLNPFYWLSLLLFWALILGGVALFVAWFGRVAGALARPPGQTSRAVEILNERFARGEISREQYEQMRDAIERRPPRAD